MAIELARAALGAALLLAAPLLGVALVVGLATSIAQTATGLQEQALSVIPKILAVGCALLALLPRLIGEASAFTLRLFALAGELGR
jgi:flagellar biosynthetic protein FliQ